MFPKSPNAANPALAAGAGGGAFPKAANSSTGFANFTSGFFGISTGVNVEPSSLSIT